MANTLKFGNGEWYGKKDTILAYNDLNSNYKPLPFNFSRNSSATVVNKDGLIEKVSSGQPRIDYKDDTKGALLLEPQRSNSLQYSENFTQSFYVKDSGVSVSSENNISPSGILNATKINVTDNGRIYANVSSNTYYSSVFIKAGGFYHFKLAGSSIDLINETNANGIIENYGNGWFRVGIPYTGNRPFQVQAYPDNTYSPHTTLGNYYIWGGQVEQGSYATSYIPTSGSAVTRVLDTCYNDNLANVIGQTEGTFYLETVPLNSLTSYTERVIQFESSGSGFMTIQRYANDNITFYGTNGSNNWSIQGTGLFVGGQTIKIAGAYKDNDITLYVNGVQIGTNTTANAPQTEKLRFANNTSGSLGYLGSHKDVKLYNTRLSNSELEALTTI